MHVSCHREHLSGKPGFRAEIRGRVQLGRSVSSRSSPFAILFHASIGCDGEARISFNGLALQKLLMVVGRRTGDNLQVAVPDRCTSVDKSVGNIDSVVAVLPHGASAYRTIGRPDSCTCIFDRHTVDNQGAVGADEDSGFETDSVPVILRDAVADHALFEHIDSAVRNAALDDAMSYQRVGTKRDASLTAV